MRAIDEYNEVENRQKDLKSRRDILFNEREELLISASRNMRNSRKNLSWRLFNGVNEQFQAGLCRIIRRHRLAIPLKTG